MVRYEVSVCEPSRSKVCTVRNSVNVEVRPLCFFPGLILSDDHPQTHTSSQNPHRRHSLFRDLCIFLLDNLVHISAAVEDSSTLASCALVSRTFRDAATLSLYREVQVINPDRGGDVRITYLYQSPRGVLKSRMQFWGNRAFAALGAHPHLRPHVRAVFHGGQPQTL